MRLYTSEGGITVRIDPGEEVITTLTEAVRQWGIDGGAIMGIGAVRDTTLGFFELETQTYHRRTFHEEMELLSLSGNITRVDGEPLIHAHALLAGVDYAAVGGHLFEATVAVTGEMFIIPTTVQIHRTLDAHSGLKLMGD